MCNRLHELGRLVESALADAVELSESVARLEDALLRGIREELERIRELVEKLEGEVAELRRLIRGWECG